MIRVVWSLEEASRGLGLSLPWIAYLRRAGAFLEPVVARGEFQWDPGRLRVWLRRQEAEAGLRVLARPDLRLLALARVGVSRGDLAARTGRSPASVQPRLGLAALAVALSVPAPERISLMDARAEGRCVAEAARTVGLSTSVALVVLDGPPAPGSGPSRRRLEHAQYMWRTGMPLTAIAGACGVRPRALQAALERAHLELTPPRWGAAQVAAHLGWTVDNVRARLRTRSLPAPDGRDGARFWWWPEAIQSWSQEHLALTCPECGARVSQLPQHQRRHR